MLQTANAPYNHGGSTLEINSFKFSELAAAWRTLCCQQIYPNPASLTLQIFDCTDERIT